jgi:hypothetical protein
MISLSLCDALLTHAEHYGVVAAHMDDEGCQKSRSRVFSIHPPQSFRLGRERRVDNAGLGEPTGV